MIDVTSTNAILTIQGEEKLQIIETLKDGKPRKTLPFSDICAYICTDT